MGTILEIFMLIPMFLNSAAATEPPMRLDRIWTQCEIIEIVEQEENKTVYNSCSEKLCSYTNQTGTFSSIYTVK